MGNKWLNKVIWQGQLRRKWHDKDSWEGSNMKWTAEKEVSWWGQLRWKLYDKNSWGGSNMSWDGSNMTRIAKKEVIWQEELSMMKETRTAEKRRNVTRTAVKNWTWQGLIRKERTLEGKLIRKELDKDM